MSSSNPAVPSIRLHSTSTAVSSLVHLAHDSFRDQINDYADAHRWIDSFFDKLESRAASTNGAPRPALSELMKTPGRKRTVGGNTTNQSAGTNQHSHPSARKDPLATLLFPAASPRGGALTDKENSGPATPASARTSPRKFLSPLTNSASNAGPAAPSPLRLSPRPAPMTAKSSPKPKQRSPVAEPPISTEAATAPVVEVIQAADANQSPVAERPVPHNEEDSVVEEIKADLSIIGEEEEEEDAATSPMPASALSPEPSQAASSLVVEETQTSQVAATAAGNPAQALSPPRNVSNASSVAPEADADAEDDHTVPLNDAPSTLRSVDLSSSLSASTTRTPGSSTSRFTLGTYSAGKLGNLGLGSSPPLAGTAPSTASGRLANPRISSGGPAPRQLNFVGLPKKSLGHGLGLGRGWTNQGASTTTDSQGSTTATVGTSQGTASQSSASAQVIEQDSVQVTSVTASGSTKRKSLNGPDSANKAPKLGETALTEQELKRKRYEELNNRMQSLQARQSVLGGRASNVTGPFGANSIFGSGPKPFGASNTNLFQQPSVPPTAKPAFANAPANSGPTTEGSGATSRRPSVMERVRSFESNTTGNEAMHPPSPSKIPAALAGGAQHSARPTSPPLSPRRLVSPGPASPRLLSRTASSNLPLAARASPRPQAAAASPRPATISRSPTIQPISASISSMLSGAETNEEAVRPQQEPALVQPKSPARSPVRTVETAPKAVYRSTSPVGSPPLLGLHDMLRQANTQQQNSSAHRNSAVVEEADEEEDEEPIQSIRAINASVPPEVVAKAAAAEKTRQEAEDAKARLERDGASRREAEATARLLEEQEAQREREELLRKRLPSLPEPRPASDDETFSSDEEAERRAAQQTSSSLTRPGETAKTVSTSAPQSDAAGEQGEDEDEQLADEDLTSLSVLSTATASATLNLSQHQPFKPVMAHKAPAPQKAHAKSSIASTISTASTSTLSRSVSNNALGSSLSKKPKIEVNAVKRAAAAAKKEKEERERQAALREEKRAALVKKKQDEERRIKAEGLEKKRKEREEAATKAAKSAALRGVKSKTDEEPAKKRKLDGDAPRPAQPTLAASQGRPPAMGPPSALNKSTGASGALNKSAGASAMIGQSFMSSKINLAGSTGPRPLQQGPKPFGPTSENLPRTALEQQQRARAPTPEPEVYQELPDIDSEYSDSDDEAAQEQKQAALPGWAKSPNLVRALQRQQEINPDDIFGPIPKLSIGEMFRNANSTARLRLRTSSARWEGTDDLTQADMARYHRAMGFRSTGQGAGSSGNQQ